MLFSSAGAKLWENMGIT